VPLTLPNPPAENQSHSPRAASKTGKTRSFPSQPSLARPDSAGPRRFGGRQPVEAPRGLLLWHLASFDAPSVAAVWSLGFAWAAGVRLPLWVPVLLVLVVWPVYVGDRLLDARACLQIAEGAAPAARNRLRERHYFHWRHRRVLAPLAVTAACAAAGIILAWMPDLARERDSFLAAASLAYFTGVHSGGRARPFSVQALSGLLSKEFLVGLLFTAGCALPAFSASQHAALWPLFGVAGLYAALAWLNCHAIDCWERRAHRSHRPPTPVSAAVVAIAAAGLTLYLSASCPRTAAMCAAAGLSALLLALLDCARGRIGPVTLRASADLTLLTPVLLLPLRWLTR